MFSLEAENLISRLSGGLHPADRAAFRRAAEAAVNAPGECWGEGLIHRTITQIWKSYFRPWSRMMADSVRAVSVASAAKGELAMGQRRRRKPYNPNAKRRPNGHNGRANGAHDRRSFYRLPAGAEVVAVQIPDPYGVSSDAEAQRAPGLRSDGTEAPGEEWRAPQPPNLVVVRSLRGDQIARMEARHQISLAQFEAGRHYQSLHEIAFAAPLRSLDLTRPVIDKLHQRHDPLSDRQEDAIRRLRLIDCTLGVRLGVDALVLVHAVLLGGRSVVDASRGLPRAKASYWRTALRFALDEIAALVGLANNRPKRPPVPERYALQAAVLVAAVRNHR